MKKIEVVIFKGVDIGYIFVSHGIQFNKIEKVSVIPWISKSMIGQ